MDNEGKSESFAAGFLRRWLPQSYFDEVSWVKFEDTIVTDAGLAHLKGLTALHMLDLTNTRVSGTGLEHLQGLTSLKVLYLCDTQVTDAGLVYLQGLTSLTLLHIENTQITDAGLATLHKALPNCLIFGP